MEKFTLKISVTDEDIKEGLPCVTDSCPIARATIRAIQEQKPDIPLRGVATFRRSMYIVTRGDGIEPDRVAQIRRLPIKAQDFIERVDRKKGVKPIKFQATFHYIKKGPHLPEIS